MYENIGWRRENVVARVCTGGVAMATRQSRHIKHNSRSTRPLLYYEAAPGIIAWLSLTWRPARAWARVSPGVEKGAMRMASSKACLAAAVTRSGAACYRRHEAEIMTHTSCQTYKPSGDVGSEAAGCGEGKAEPP